MDQGHPGAASTGPGMYNIVLVIFGHHISQSEL